MGAKLPGKTSFRGTKSMGSGAPGRTSMKGTSSSYGTYGGGRISGTSNQKRQPGSLPPSE